MTNDTQGRSNVIALANRQPPLQRSTQAIARCEARLQPATQKAGTAELLACLTLVAPSGMSVEDRTAWVAVARETLSGIPADLLQAGCRKARETCRFASEIVPTILSETKAEWSRRRGALNEERAIREQIEETIRARAAEPVPVEETQRILKEVREAMATRA